jgi:hypothetical protein
MNESDSHESKLTRSCGYHAPLKNMFCTFLPFRVRAPHTQHNPALIDPFHVLPGFLFGNVRTRRPAKHTAKNIPAIPHQSRNIGVPES